MNKHLSILTMTVALLLVVSHRQSRAQNLVQFLPTGTADWNTSTSWQDIGAGQNIPSAAFDEIGVIAAGGTAQVSMASATNAGGVQINNGALRILSGGSLAVTPGFGGLAQGLIDLNTGGTLSVASGGTLSAQSFASGGNLRTIGTTALLTSTDQFTFEPSGTFTAEIKAATHSTISSGGIATLDGSFVADFTGYSPNVNDTWDLVTAPSIAGTFDSITAVGIGPLPLGQALTVKTLTGGAQGKVARLSIDRQLVLTVNRTTGVISIRNPQSVPIVMDSYAIRSAIGSLNGGAWNSLQDQGTSGGTWFETGSGGSSNRLSELNRGSQTSLSASSLTPLGAVYSPNFTSFGVETEDFTFTYATPGSSDVVNAQVEYVGDKVFNNIVLTVDPATGQSQIRNESPFSVAIEGYVIASSGGGLRFGNANWSSLQDQGVQGGAWFEADSDTHQLAELRDNGATTLGTNQGYNMGALFNTSSAQDLTFQFLLNGESAPMTGAVVYGSLPIVTPPSAGLAGDYNNNGIVDAADYIVWRNHLGSSIILPNDSTPGTVTTADYQVWRSHFGATGGTGASELSGAAVPEPATLGLLVAITVYGSSFRRRLTSVVR